jgi:virginiamycin B lyase
LAWIPPIRGVRPTGGWSGITVGSDGALWFVNSGNNSIGQLTTSGVVSNFTGTGIDNPFTIAAGPNGALWFTNYNNGSIGEITTAGIVTNYPYNGSTDYGTPWGIAAGPDGAMWFTTAVFTGFTPMTGERHSSKHTGYSNIQGNSIGRITMNGVFTFYTASTLHLPSYIAAGSDGAMWFTNYNPGSIGRISVAPTVSVTPSSNHQGNPIDITGADFAPGETVKVTYKTGLAAPHPASVVLCTAMAASDGTFACTATVPGLSESGKYGVHKIVAKGETSHDKATTTFHLIRRL